MNIQAALIFVLLNMLFLNNPDPAHTKSMSVLEKTFKSKNSNRNFLTATVIQIMTKCFTRITDQVVFAGDWADFSSLRRGLSPYAFSVIGMSQSSMFLRHQRLQGSYELTEQIVKKLRYPASLFIISVPSQSIDDLLARVKNSIFWNAEATFLFVDEDPSHSCSNFIEILDSAWKFNILQAVYMCQSAIGKVTFYNFNPYTDLAPVPWKIADVSINLRRNHPVTIYRILHDDLISDSCFCDKLYYDKVSSLSGYPMRLCGIKDNIFLIEKRAATEEHQKLDNFEGIDAWISQIIWAKLEACPTVKILNQSGFINNNVPYGLIKRIIDGEFDMGVNQYYYRSFWRLQTYPHGVEDMCALSREQHNSQTSGMALWIFEPGVVTIIALASFLMAVLLKHLLRISLMQASFSVFSLLLGLSTRLPKLIASRVNLGYVMLLMFVLNVYLGCSLTSFLVAPNHAFNVDSLEDIINYKYRAFGAAYVKEYLIDENFSKLFNVGHINDCLSKLKTSDKVVCIQTCVNGFYYRNLSSYLHISKSSIKSIYRTFLTREDWPLQNKFNFLVQKMRETGILKYLRQTEIYKFEMKNRRHMSNHSEESANNTHLPVKRETMTFAWYTLIAGMLLSSVAFFLELLMYRNSSSLIE